MKLKRIKIYADGADYSDFVNLNKSKIIKGFTTNPSLMRKSGVKNYEKFAKKLIKVIKKPISFEVFSDELDEMYIQAKKISSWGNNVYVKIPIVNSKGVSTIRLIKKLNLEKIKLNITAVFTFNQVNKIINILNSKTPSIISIFAGRIADTGIDPINILKRSIKLKKNNKNIKILWASTREVLNIYQAENINCDIITVPIGIIKKLNLYKKNLKKYSIETAKDFYLDGLKSKYKI
jgi:transaldolase|tara:strand:- start:3692 stop:4396 length:705 start_codon:yes stop_codon:yes gene_type:complete